MITFSSNIPKIYLYHWFIHPLCITICAEINGSKAIEIMLAFIWSIIVDSSTMLTRWREYEHVYGCSIDSYWRWRMLIRVVKLTFTIRKRVDSLVLALGLYVSVLTSDAVIDNDLAS